MAILLSVCPLSTSSPSVLLSRPLSVPLSVHLSVPLSVPVFVSLTSTSLQVSFESKA